MYMCRVVDLNVKGNGAAPTPVLGGLSYGTPYIVYNFLILPSMKSYFHENKVGEERTDGDVR